MVTTCTKHTRLENLKPLLKDNLFILTIEYVRKCAEHTWSRNGNIFLKETLVTLAYISCNGYFLI